MTLTPLFVPGLIANDIHRSGPTRVISGVVLGATFTAGSTWTLAGLFGVPAAFGLSVPAVFTLTVLTGVAVFGPQIMNLAARLRSGVSEAEQAQPTV